jgi:hypothetical protein
MQVRSLPCAPSLAIGSWHRASVTPVFADCLLPTAYRPTITACRGAWPSLPALEAGDRWFKSTHADQLHLVRPADERGRLLSGASVFRPPPRAPPQLELSRTWMVGRAVRQRDANAPRPFGLRRFDPCTIRHAGVAQWQSRCLPSRRREFDSRCPLQHRHVRLAAEDTGPSNRIARVRIPHVAPLRCPFA